MKRAVRENFEASACAYEAYERDSGLFAGLARRLADEMAARGDLSRVLDAGAGTGASTRVLRERGDAVALDVARGMLERNADPRVVGDLDRLPFRAGAFSTVAFTASLFLVPDPGAAAREAARVLEPGGVVGAVAPLGWEQGGASVFAGLDRESRSPSSTGEVVAALDGPFQVETGEWAVESDADDLRAFHAVPAMAARLFPHDAPAERPERIRSLLADVSGDVTARWRWVVGTREA